MTSLLFGLIASVGMPNEPVTLARIAGLARVGAGGAPIRV